MKISKGEDFLCLMKCSGDLRSRGEIVIRIKHTREQKLDLAWQFVWRLWRACFDAIKDSASQLILQLESAFGCKSGQVYHMSKAFLNICSMVKSSDDFLNVHIQTSHEFRNFLQWVFSFLYVLEFVNYIIYIYIFLMHNYTLSFYFTHAS